MSRVTDPLREYIAKTWDGSMYVNQVPMRLLEIADQIDTEHERLEQGNEKLRKLVRKLLWFFCGNDWECNRCDWVDECTDDPPCVAPQKIEEMARELGFEVYE